MSMVSNSGRLASPERRGDGSAGEEAEEGRGAPEERLGHPFESWKRPRAFPSLFVLSRLSSGSGNVSSVEHSRKIGAKRPPAPPVPAFHPKTSGDGDTADKEQQPKHHHVIPPPDCCVCQVRRYHGDGWVEMLSAIRCLRFTSCFF